jgi:hypothetical protein
MKDDFRERIRNLPENVGSREDLIDVNNDTTIFEGEMQLSQGNNQTSTTTGRIYYTWKPSPRIMFQLREAPLGLDLEASTLLVGALNLSTEVLLTNTGNQDYSHKGIIQSPLVIGDTLNCTEAIFFLANFQEYLGELIRNGEGTKSWRGRLELISHPWLIIIDSTENTKMVIESLKREGGYGITHIGKIKRIDNKEFNYADANEIASALTYFLSFCRGRWSSIVCTKGYGGADLIWQQWNTKNITSWKYTEHWFPHQEPTELQNLSTAFDGFLKRWTSPIWNDPIKIAIHWYVEANIGAGGEEGGVVLAQTALELLSWMYLVEDSSTSKYSSSAFDKGSAAEKIKELMSELKIPSVIPTEFTELQNEAQQSAINNGIDILVKLRNGVVHPKYSKRSAVLQMSLDSRHEAKQLILWYLELILLAILGYRGLYYRRYIKDYYSKSLAKVPWV